MLLRSPEEMTVFDYIWCDNCKMFHDLWKYTNISDTMHWYCEWRYVNRKELKQCVEQCKYAGCFNEVGL